MEFQNQNQGQQGASELNKTVFLEGGTVGFPWRMLIFSGILFGFFLLAFAGLKFGYEMYLTNQSDSIDKEISKLETQISTEEQKAFIEFYSQLANLETVLDEHSFGGNVLKFLESQTLPTVYYISANYVEGEQAVVLSGVSNTVEDLAAQMMTLENASDVKSVVLNKMGFGTDNKVKFDMTVSFQQTFFVTPLY
jgi:hypothetical protein